MTDILNKDTKEIQNSHKEFIKPPRSIQQQIVKYPIKAYTVLKRMQIQNFILSYNNDKDGIFPPLSFARPVMLDTLHQNKWRRR